MFSMEGWGLKLLNIIISQTICYETLAKINVVIIRFVKELSSRWLVHRCIFLKLALLCLFKMLHRVLFELYTVLIMHYPGDWVCNLFHSFSCDSFFFLTYPSVPYGYSYFVCDNSEMLCRQFVELHSEVS